MAISLDNLAGLYGDTGDFEKAERLFRRALQIREKSLGPDTPDTGSSVKAVAPPAPEPRSPEPPKMPARPKF